MVAERSRLFPDGVDGVHEAILPCIEALLVGVGIESVAGSYVVDRHLFSRMGSGTGTVWFATDIGLARLRFTIGSAEFKGAELQLVPWNEVHGSRVMAQISFEGREKPVMLTFAIEHPELEVTADSVEARDAYRQLQSFVATVVWRSNKADK